MARVLVTWIGKADCEAAQGLARGLGPVGQAVTSLKFDRVVLLSNYGKAVDTAYLRWLKKQSSTELELQPKRLRSPTHLEDIYLAVTETLEGLTQSATPGALSLTFHTSPGTGPMAAMWIILARSRFPAELLTSSLDHGVTTLEAPFELAADFVTRQVGRFEAGLTQIAEARPPAHVAFGTIQHKSPSMQVAIARAQVVAGLSAPVLLEGESGTGKELFARAIHQASDRRTGPFVAVNCGALPRELVQSSLFGHVKGAFTGAVSAQPGFFRQAEGGTLFLDEIGELPLDQQVHLLRTLQERTIVPVGAARELPVDVRILAATHRKLHEDIRSGQFREDLYYRLAMLVVRLPALRERGEDAGLLLDGLMPDVARRLGTRPKKLSPAARRLALGHPWPGNVRELEGVLARALAWSHGDTIDEAEMREALLLDGGLPAPQILDRSLGNGFSLEAVLNEVKRHYLERAEHEARGVKTRAAELLGFANYQRYDYWRKNL